jgi:5-methyltetrahydrofolate--homocysteine methyltransferase
MQTIMERIASGEKLVADGATGTNLKQRGLDPTSSAEQWVLENPGEIVRLHTDFIEAGSDIILTSTFGGTGIRLEHTGTEGNVNQVNSTAVELAKKAKGDRNVYIAGSVGPTGVLMRPLGAMEKDQAYSEFETQIKHLFDGGVDLLVIETFFALEEAEQAVSAAKRVASVPIVCSFTYDRGNRTMMGVKPQQMAAACHEWGVDIVGINCGRSLEENYQILQELRAATKLPIWFKPNAGLPDTDDDANSVYRLTPEEMGESTKLWVEAGASIVGGCCGTTPQHIKQIALSAKG